MRSFLLLFAVAIATTSVSGDPCPRSPTQEKKVCVSKSRCSKPDAPICNKDPGYVMCPVSKASNPTIFEMKCAEWASLVKTCELDPSILSDGYYEEDHCTAGQPLVVGGRNASPKEYPFMALIGYGRGDSVNWLCGGTLISERWVLSAAHCTYHTELRLAAGWVLLGDLIVGNTPEALADDAKPQILRISERHNYEEYSDRTRYHDIALYKLQKAAQLSQYVRPACLNIATSTVETDAIVTGWGATANFSFSAHLQGAKVGIFTADECKKRAFNGKTYPQFPSGLQDNKMLCAGGTIGVDTCVGDSGGPASVPSGLYCTNTVVGVTSVGIGRECAQLLPSVYTKVAFYMDWIKELVFDV